MVLSDALHPAMPLLLLLLLLLGFLVGLPAELTHRMLGYPFPEKLHSITDESVSLDEIPSVYQRIHHATSYDLNIRLMSGNVGKLWSGLGPKLQQKSCWSCWFSF